MDYDLKELERKAYRSTFQDGLWDIYLGLVFMAFGLAPVTRSVFGLSETSSMVVYMAMLLIAMVVLIGGKRVVTVPRLGYVRFGEERKRKLFKLRLVLAASFVFGVVVFALLAKDSLGLDGVIVVFAANILIVLGAMAYFMNYDRLFGYAVIWSLSLPVGVVLEKHYGLSDAPMVFILTGGIAVVIGAVLFQRFVRDYRLPPEEERYG